jgi:hypothetical protein
MANWKPIAITGGIVVLLAGGWALFRPELLFVNQKVNEKSPSASTPKAETIAKGSFKSYAHESGGDALVIKTDNKYVLRFENFKTSNGPDVHVYLVKNADPGQDSVNKNGFLDLGTLKGNLGDQNYDLPADFDLKTYGSVSIWCKRFGVDFAGAPLAQAQTNRDVPHSAARLAAFFSAPEIVVTHGQLSGKATGNAGLVESGGKRFVRIKGLKLPKGSFKVLLVKAEDAKETKEIKAAPQIVLGKGANGTVSFPIDDKVDAWLYRTVSIWDAKKSQSIAVAHLRSDQELKKMLLFI